VPSSMSGMNKSALPGKNGQEPFRHRGKGLFCFALILGLLLTFLIPPFDSPDELTHFQNVWAIGHGQVFTREYWAEGKLALPAGFAPLMDEYPVRLMGVENQEKCSWDMLFRQSMEYVPDGKMMPAEGRIFSFGYLFSALGMAIASGLGSLLGLFWFQSPYIQLLFGRMSNWIFFVLVMRAAVRKEQPFRQTLFLLAVMPMCLFLGATLNYDAILIPVSFYLFASILSCLQNNFQNGPERLTSGDYIRLVLCALFLCGIKAVYVCLMLLFLLLPRETLEGPDRSGVKHRITILLAAAIGFVLAGIPYLVPAGGATGYAAEQVAWLTAHPLALPGIILRTLWKDAASLIIGFWGCFGWLDVHIPRIFLIVGWIILLGTAVLECCTFPFPLSWRKRLPGLIASVLVYCVLCTLQYISHAPKVNGNIIGGDYSIGFQGRYLIPCFLPFLLTFANGSLSRKRPELVPSLKKKAAVVAAVWSACCCLITVITLFTRYWV